LERVDNGDKSPLLTYDEKSGRLGIQNGLFLWLHRKSSLVMMVENLSNRKSEEFEWDFVPA